MVWKALNCSVFSWSGFVLVLWSSTFLLVLLQVTPVAWYQSIVSVATSCIHLISFQIEFDPKIENWNWMSRHYFRGWLRPLNPRQKLFNPTSVSPFKSQIRICLETCQSSTKCQWKHFTPCQVSLKCQQLNHFKMNQIL